MAENLEHRAVGLARQEDVAELEPREFGWFERTEEEEGCFVVWPVGRGGVDDHGMRRYRGFPTDVPILARDHHDSSYSSNALLGQQQQFHASRSDDPDAIGPYVEVASGDDWALIAWNSKVGVCVDFAIPGNSPFSCDFPVRGAKTPGDTTGAGAPVHAVAGFVSGAGLVGSDGKTTVFGVTAREVGAVEVELRDGRLTKAPLYDAPSELDREIRFFIIRLFLPPSRGENPVLSFRAFDSRGELIERVDA